MRHISHLLQRGIISLKYQRSTRLVQKSLQCALILGALSTTSGCLKSENASTDAVDSDHADAEHHDHFVPSHKPHDFESLTEQLSTRLETLFQLNARHADEQHHEQIGQLSDIIAWIPEIAAESDLRKTEFEKVVEQGRQLGLLLEKTLQSPSSQKPDTTEILKILDSFRDMVPASKQDTLQV